MKKGKESKRNQPRDPTENQEAFQASCSARLFAITLEIREQWLEEESRSVNMPNLYRRIRAFVPFSYRPRLVIPLTAK